MKKRSKRVLSLVLSVLLVLGSCVFVSASELDKAKSDLNDKNKELKDTQAELNLAKKQQSKLTSDIKTLENQIYITEVSLNQLQQDLNETIDEINEVVADLEKREGELNDQNNDLNARLRSMYKNGNVGMLSVLLGSTSMSDLMTNLEMSQKIYAMDADLLEKMQSEYDDVMAKKVRLSELKEKYETQQADITAKREGLAENKATLAEKKSQVDADIKELNAQVDALNKEANALTAQILLLQSRDQFVGGTWLWPSAASKYVSSPFGNRLHPILKVYKMHTGIDIAAPYGTNILASNAGRVISAGYNSGYGYMVMLDHGGGYVTLYAHASKLLVKTGDVVARGKVIALVGSTGMSTGAHLHFEVRINGEYKNPLNYVSR